MYEGHSVGAIVPAYNEADSVGAVLDAIPAFVDRIFVVDDCSTDETWDVVQAYAADTEPQLAVADGGTAANQRVVPIQHEENQGAGGALKTGYHHAEAAELGLVVTIDADGQMDPAIMDRFLDPLVARKRAFAKGDRLASAEHRDAMPPFRLVGNVMLTGLTRIASGYWHVRDPQNGYTAITHDALAAIDVEALPDHHDYCNALFAQLQVADVDVVDVPMAAVYGDEESTISLGSFVPRTSKTLTRSFLWRLREQYLSSDGASPGATDEAAETDEAVGTDKAVGTDGGRSTTLTTTRAGDDGSE